MRAVQSFERVGYQVLPGASDWVFGRQDREIQLQVLAGWALAANELGETRSGFAAALVGPVIATVAGGIAAICVTLLWAGLFPELRRARTFELPDPAPEEADVVASGV